MQVCFHSRQNSENFDVLLCTPIISRCKVNWSLFNPLAVPALHRLSPFSPTNRLLIENHRSLIQICITPSLESTPCFFPSASPVMSRFTSLFTCQLISVIITTLIIHHSFTLSLHAQNLVYKQILPTLDFFYLCLHDNGTGHFYSLIFSFTF